MPGNQIVGARITQPSQSHQLNDCVTEENNITVLQQAKDVVKEKCMHKITYVILNSIFLQLF